MDSSQVSSFFSKVFFPVAILSAFALVVLVFQRFSLVYGILGTYSVLGLLAGATIFYSGGHQGNPVELTGPARLSKISYIACLFSFALAVITGWSLLVAVGLAVTGPAILYQIGVGQSSRELLPQVLIFFLITPLIKYVNSGFYFIVGDLFRHIRYVNLLVDAGSIDGLRGTRYAGFPGFHVLGGSTSVVAGIQPYDALSLLALVAMSILVPITYRVTQVVSKNGTMGVAVAFALVLNKPFIVYVSNSHPQMLALSYLGVVVLVVASGQVRWKGVVVIVVTTASLTLTHHLTQVLAGPVVGIVLLFNLIQQRGELDRLWRSPAFRSCLFIGITLAGYWSLVASNFLLELQTAIFRLLQGGIRGNQTNIEFLQLGGAPAGLNPTLALQSLSSPFGIYRAGLLAVFSVGVAVWLRRTDMKLFSDVMMFAGILSSTIMFDTLLGIKSLRRIRLLWTLVFSFVVGAGLLWTAEKHLAPLSKLREIRVRHLFALLVLSATVTSAPLTTNDDYFGINPRPTADTSLSEREYEGLRTTSEFIRRHGTGSQLTTLYHTRQLLRLFGLGDTRGMYLTDSSMMIRRGLFLYRKAWPGNSVPFIYQNEGFYASRIVMTKDWLDRRIEQSNRVYTVGEVGLLWSDSGIVVGNVSSV